MFSKQIQAAGGRGARVVRAEPEALDRVDFEDFDIRRGITAMAESSCDTHFKYQACAK